jgi:hypothetical protein
MDPGATLVDHMVESVAGLSVPDVRLAFATIRRAQEAHPDSFWTLFMPRLGMSMGDFCVGYLLRTTGAGR